MLPKRPALERRILAALEVVPPRIPVVVGECGSGRTTLLRRLEELLGPESEYHDVERVATTPEAFLASITQTSRYRAKAPDAPLNAALSARASFDQGREFFAHACTRSGSRVTFLLAEVLEIRTFESFPGLRQAPREFWETLCKSSNRFVLTTRFIARARRLFHDAPDRFEFVDVPPLSPAEVSTALHGFGLGTTNSEQLELGRIIHALADGRPRYLRHLAEATATMGAGDPVSSLATQMATGAQLSMACRFSYELRLHRARGYGALKAILQILSREEPLTLTEIARRLGRTPGSTKDYLSWLADVDLLNVRQKRYRFADPVLRLWVRLHGRAVPPNEEDLAREVQEYAVSRFPYMESVPASRSQPVSTEEQTADLDRSWNLVEID